MKTQSNNLRRLATILKIFNENDFYVITLYPSEIKLQGNFNSDVVRTARKTKFKETTTEQGYLEFYRGIYNITLT